MPSSAKMHMKRKSRSRREAMDWMLLVSDITRLDKAFQYLISCGERRCVGGKQRKKEILLDYCRMVSDVRVTRVWVCCTP